MKPLDDFEVWFLTGSQGLYGEDVLRQVADNSGQIAKGIDADDSVPVRIVAKPVVTSAEGIEEVCRLANTAANCVGVIAWMHTFSPAKMWIPAYSLSTSRCSISTRSSTVTCPGMRSTWIS